MDQISLLQQALKIRTEGLSGHPHGGSKNIFTTKFYMSSQRTIRQWPNEIVLKSRILGNTMRLPKALKARPSALQSRFHFQSPSVKSVVVW